MKETYQDDGSDKRRLGVARRLFSQNLKWRANFKLKPEFNLLFSCFTPSPFIPPFYYDQPLWATICSHIIFAPLEEHKR